MLSFLPRFEEHLETLQADPSTEDDHELSIKHLAFFIDLLKREYARKLETLASLVAEQQITFDFVWGVFVPGSVLLTHCGVTHEPLAVRLISCTLVRGFTTYWNLRCENVDVSSGLPGRGDHSISIQQFSGAEDIVDLPAFPMAPYLEDARREELCAAMIARGRRHWELAQRWCHKDYDAVAYSLGRKMAVCVRAFRARRGYS